jgi:hypothetical protein
VKILKRVFIISDTRTKRDAAGKDDHPKVQTPSSPLS